MGIVFFKRLALAVALVRETWILDIVPDYRDEETVLTVAGRIVSAPSEEAACGSGFDVVEQRFEKSGEAGSNIGLKTVFCRDTVHPFKRSLELLANVEQEVAIHQGLDHPHIIKLLFAVKALAERRDLDHRVYLGLELANGGTLRRQMLKGEPLGQAGIKTFVQLVSAVQYLHTVALVVHRDLNPNNVLFDEKGHVKLADFGCSMPLNKMGANPQRTPGYAAPEVMIYEEVPNGSNDMWALGVLYFEGLTGIRFDSAMKDSGGDIVACVPKEDVTSRAILSHLIVNDPMGRWTITQLSDYLHASLG